MITNKQNVQGFTKQENSPIAKAIRYYKLLSAINDLPFTEREIQLIAFTAIKGNISYSTNREEFCKEYGSSPATINNMISKLKPTGVLIKESGKIKVNPLVLHDFNENLILQIKING